MVRSYSEETCRFVLETFLRRFDVTAQSPQSPACWPVLIQRIGDHVSRCRTKHSDTLAGLIPSGTSYSWKNALCRIICHVVPSFAASERMSMSNGSAARRWSQWRTASKAQACIAVSRAWLVFSSGTEILCKQITQPELKEAPRSF